MTETAVASDGGRVSTLELFFDLVFVFTITQLTSVVDHHPGPVAALQALLTLIVLYWMYGGFVWLTNATGANGVLRRFTVLAGMAALLICSLAVPEAFGADGLVFGLAYLTLICIHALGFLWLSGPDGRRGMLRLLPINLSGAALILVAGFTESWVDWLLWGVTSAVFVGTLFGIGRFAGFRVEAEHFAERHGLMIIIVLGESIISVGQAAVGGADISSAVGGADTSSTVGQHVNARLVVGALCGFAAVAAMWWSYFVHDDTAAAHTLAAHEDSRLPFGAGVGYDLTHIVMIAGIIAVAAGTRLGLTDLLRPAESAAGGVLIGCGAAVYLLGTAWFRGLLHFAAAGPRLIGAVLVLATIPAGLSWGTGQQLAMVAGVIALVVAAEQFRTIPNRTSLG